MAMHRTSSIVGGPLPTIGSSPSLKPNPSVATVLAEVEAVVDGPKFDQWLFGVPKVDLHAHLNGSISPQLLNVLITEYNTRQHQLGASEDASAESGFIAAISDSDEELKQYIDPKSRMNHCFRAFDSIYKVVDNLEYTVLVVEDVLCAYAAENTMYLELRTSLREMRRTAASPATEPLATRREYVQTVWNTIQHLQEQGPSQAAAQRYYDLRPRWHAELSFNDYLEVLSDALRAMSVRLLLSINRAAPTDVAEDTVAIAKSFRKEPPMSPHAVLAHGSGTNAAVPLKMVGIDFCGNCYKGTFQAFIPILQDAASDGLELSIHAGEKDDDAEVAQMIAINPARFGHLVFLSAEHMAQIRELKIPTEFCITSNMITGGLNAPHQHHLEEWFFGVVVQNDGDTAAKSLEGLDLHVLPSVSSNPNLMAAAGGGLASAGTSRPHTPNNSHLSAPKHSIGTIKLDYRSEHPLSINTDDRGVFYTSITRELRLFAKLLLHHLLERSDPNARTEFTVDCILTWLLNAIIAVQRDALTQGLTLASDELTLLEESFDRRAPEPSAMAVMDNTRK